MKRVLRLRLILVIVAMLCIIVLVFFFCAPTPSFPPVPNPNGYDDLVRAGNLMTQSTNVLYEMAGDELRAFGATNSEALRLARVGLSRTCSVPTAEITTNFDAHLSDLSAIKQLAQLFCGEGKLAELTGRTNDAARSYLDAIRLGNEVSR